jgi:hypothetical protein
MILYLVLFGAAKLMKAHRPAIQQPLMEVEDESNRDMTDEEILEAENHIKNASMSSITSRESISRVRHISVA